MRNYVAALACIIIDTRKYPVASFRLQRQISSDCFEMARRWNLLDEVLLGFKFIDCDLDECNDTSDSEDDRLNRRERVQRMIAFYEDRIDIFFEYFDDIQLIQAFRFNRSGIKYITGMFCLSTTLFYSSQ
jgi:hypothetical protein